MLLNEGLKGNLCLTSLILSNDGASGIQVSTRTAIADELEYNKEAKEYLDKVEATKKSFHEYIYNYKQQ